METDRIVELTTCPNCGSDCLYSEGGGRDPKYHPLPREFSDRSPPALGLWMFYTFCALLGFAAGFVTAGAF